MTRRSPMAVLFLPTITLGIYTWVWLVKTKEEMKARGADIPSAWMLIIPIASLVWLWRYAKGVARITSGAQTAGSAFCLILFLGSIGMAITQSAFNKVAHSERGR